MAANQIVLFRSSDGAVSLPVQFEADTLWLSRMQMADLFGVTPQNITLHLKNVYKSGELQEEATRKESLLVQVEGRRQIARKVLNYNLDAIISVGYRVNSHRATQFRIWATSVLKEYVLRGYAINQNRLMQLGQAHCRPHACRPDGDDRRIEAAGEGDDGQSRDELLGVTHSGLLRRNEVFGLRRRVVGSSVRDLRGP